jgi:IS1 family transposase
MNKMSNERRAQIIRGLVEGNSIASLVRMTGVAKTTILRLVVEFGEACEKFHDERVVKLNTRRLQCDEVWAFVGAKEKNASFEKKLILKWGDAWTWTALDSDSKLMISWIIGPRHAGNANAIMRDVASRLNNRVQVTTDGHHSYRNAVANAFGVDRRSDYAQCVKIYGKDSADSTAARYGPSECTGVEIKVMWGDPDPEHITTSHVERSNLTVRMGVRRYTRLTNGHSKKIENHVAMTTIFMTCYNWCRVHQTLRVTPAMEAGLTDHVWEIEELLSLAS